MNKLDKMLKCDWHVEIKIDIFGDYIIHATHREHSPIYAAGRNLKEAINQLYRKVWQITG